MDWLSTGLSIIPNCIIFVIMTVGLFSEGGGVTVGDFVVTAGGNSQYPKDLKIGRITELTPSSDGLSVTALVEPFADIQNTNNVLVITDFKNG